jgi:hypothetical protein
MHREDALVWLLPLSCSAKAEHPVFASGATKTGHLRLLDRPPARTMTKGK